MTYKESIIRIYKEYGKDGLDNSYLSFSIISDDVKADYYQKRLAAIFYQINKDDNIFKIFKDKGIVDGRNYFKSIYKSKYKDTCKVEEYMDMINPISEIACPKEYLLHQPKTIKAVVTPVKKICKTPLIHKNNNVPVVNKPVKKRNDILINGSCNYLFIKVHKKPDITFIDEKTGQPLSLRRSTDKSGREVLNITTKRDSVILYLPDWKYNSIEIDVSSAYADITYGNENHLRCNDVMINPGIMKHLNMNVKSTGTLNIDHVQSDVSIDGEFNNLSVNCDGILSTSIYRIGDEVSLISNQSGVIFCIHELKFHLTFKERFIEKKIDRYVKRKNGGFTHLVISAAKGHSLYRI